MAKVKDAKLKDLVFDNKNMNKHTEFGMSLIEKSLRNNGAGRSILIDKNNRIIAGNGVTEVAGQIGLDDVQIVETDGTKIIAVKRTDIDLDTKQGREMALADNATGAADLQWDAESIADVESEFDIDASAWGVDVDFEDDAEQPTASEDDFDENTDAVDTRCKKGDIWKLGEHRLMCGDSTDADAVAKLMNGERADLVFTDPPYGMKKESEGVLNDNLNFDDLLEFNKRWIPLTFANLKDNGSWYCWGIDEPLMDIYSNILRPMQKQGRITFRNLITWDKGSVRGMKSESGMMYAVADEKCLFVMCGIQDNKMRNTEVFNERFESIRNYFKEEKKKSGLSTEDLSKIDSTRVSHYWANVQFEFPTKEAYEKIQSYCELNHIQAFKMRYEDLRQEYERIANRAYFDNTHDNMNNVWEFNRTKGDERAECGDHATPKPLALCERAIKTSSRDGETVLDLFGGSGSTLIACEQLNRKCYMMELDPHYCDVIIARWEKLTGLKAERLTDGKETDN